MIEETEYNNIKTKLNCLCEIVIENQDKIYLLEERVKVLESMIKDLEKRVNSMEN